MFQIEFARKNVHNANQKIQGTQDKLYLSWVEWKRSIGYDDTDESHCAEVRPGTESCTTVSEEVVTRLLSVLIIPLECYYDALL